MGGGNDTVRLDSSVTVPAILIGGNENNTLVSASSSRVTMSGGVGEDVLDASRSAQGASLAGGTLYDLLLGGRGADGLYGNEGVDLLDGGDDLMGVPIGLPTANRLGSSPSTTGIADASNPFSNSLVSTNRATYPFPVSPILPTITPRGISDILNGGPDRDTAVFDPADRRTSIETLVDRVRGLRRVTSNRGG